MTSTVRRVVFKDAVDEDRDRTIYRLAPRATYDVSPGLGAFIQPHYQLRDYDDTEFGSNRDRDSQRSEEHTSELQSLMRISYAVFCLKKKKIHLPYKNLYHSLLFSSITTN